MGEKRKFCRFSKYWPSNLAINEIPEGGFCLSTFLVLRNKERPSEILLGKINPTEDWEYIGALDKDRAQKISQGWMLPSSHLIFGEDPLESAKRIAREQLGIEINGLRQPIIISYLYPSLRDPKLIHWDIEFVFLLDIDPSIIKQHKAWKELKFIKVQDLAKKDFSRDHGDVLESIGYRIKSD
ncbi:MAG TPA: hypothetical protein VKU94_07270 [Geobacterales bacterium]|nr:hypothetical protein [Geobacterales bacterium]